MSSTLQAVWQKLLCRASESEKNRSRSSRILWVHAGGHKTGSKTIQNYLYLGGLQVTAPELFYRGIQGVKDPKYMNCGNGLSLLPLPKNKDLGLALEEFLGSAAQAVISTEQFSFLNKEEWQRLDVAAAERGIEMRVVFFVRDALPYLISAYDQRIKEGGTHSEFKDWASTGEWLHAGVLRNLVRVFPRDRLRVRHYESERTNLLRAFFQSMGISEPRLAPLAEEIGTLNRGLTYEERELLLFLNRNFQHALLSESMNRGLLAADPQAKPEPLAIPVGLREELLARFQGEISWINQTFFPGCSGVGIGTVGEGRRERSLEETAAKTLRVHQSALVILMQKVLSAEKNHRDRLCHRLRTLDRENLSDPKLPQDFDPVAYLLLNPDLLQSKTPIVHHFLQHGQQEGRLYKL